ncbi:MAG: competence/damage-inducible protein A [Alphaproteobacteria bacterium]
MKTKTRTAGIIIIGNEILSGKTLETNSNFICKEFFKIGVVCEEIRVIKDLKVRIIEVVKEFRNKYNYVFTSGGIGPTHDDITTDAISSALNRKLLLNKDAKERLTNHYSDDVLTKARLKMAYIPEDAVLIDNPVSVAPGYVVENVYVFPGVPKILEIMVKEIVRNLDQGERFFKKTVSTTLSEGIIGEFVESVQAKYNDLEIGSYPYFKKNRFGVSLVIKGRKEEQVKMATEEIFDYIHSTNGQPRIF